MEDLFISLFLCLLNDTTTKEADSVLETLVILKCMKSNFQNSRDPGEHPARPTAAGTARASTAPGAPGVVQKGERQHDE